MSLELRKQLIRHEGLKLKPYKDSVGKLTIGVGRNIQDAGISVSEAELLLDNDIRRCEGQLRGVLPWTQNLDPVRFDVLVNMCFNLGLAGLLKWRPTLALIEKGDYEGAAARLLEGKWARQVKSRAVELAQQLKSGQYSQS